LLANRQTELAAALVLQRDDDVDVSLVDTDDQRVLSGRLDCAAPTLLGVDNYELAGVA